MLEMLIVEGNLLEVSVQEKDTLYHILQSCCPADYGQVVFDFPVSFSFVDCECKIHANFALIAVLQFIFKMIAHSYLSILNGKHLFSRRQNLSMF
jgi:hypothetical protein